MMVALGGVRVASCRGVLVLPVLCGTASADFLANAPIPAPTMDLPRHLA